MAKDWLLWFFMCCHAKKKLGIGNPLSVKLFKIDDLLELVEQGVVMGYHYQACAGGCRLLEE
jgi:hypothetical protein